MIGDITSQLAALVVDALRRNSSLRKGTIVVSALLLIAAIILYVGRFYWIRPVAMVADVMPPLIAISAGSLLLALASFTRIQFASLEAELDSLRDSRHEIQARIAQSREAESKPDETVLDTIQLSLNQITEYYTINKSQARSSFRFSVFAMVAGLATIIAGIWLAFFREAPDKQVGLITAASGALIQFISGAYFWMHQKSLSQLNFFYEKLVKMQDTMLAIQLSETLPEEQRHETTKHLIASLMERSSTATDLTSPIPKMKSNKTLHPTAGKAPV